MQRGTAAAALIAVALATSIARAQVVSMVKDFSGETYESVAIDDAGQSIYVVATSNQFGTNPGLQRQIFRWDAASGAGAQLTSFPAGIRQVSVTDDDQWLAFVSTGDLTGGNHDESSELFIMKTDGTSVTQLTNDTSLAGDGVFTAMISGSGNRIAFISDADPLGTNPAREPHVFAVDRDGSDLAQLAEAYLVDLGAQISDDGTRVVFADREAYPGPTNIFGVASDGSTPPGLIATLDHLDSVRLSGNGGKVAYSAGGISTVNYDGTDPHSNMVQGVAPALSDDGQSVFYSVGGLWKANPDGTGAVLVKADAPPLRFSVAAASGNGGRLAVHGTGGTPPGGHNPDGGAEVIAMDNTGSNVHQLTDLNVPKGNFFSLTAAADASRVFLVSTDDPTGANSEHYGELFTLLANGTGLAQVTEGGLYDEDYSVSDTNVVVFWGWNDLTGQNPCHTAQVFKVNLGGPVTQLTNNCPTGDYSYMPRIRSDGQFIFFQGSHTVGSNLDGSRELFRMTIAGTGITPLTNDNSNTSKYPVISTTTSPTWIAYLCDDNRDGQNPTRRAQVCRVNSNGAGYRRLTADPVYNSYATDISGDGDKILVESNADLAGENPDHRVRIFYYDVPTASFHQLSHGSRDAFDGNISRDGSWVYFKEVSGLPFGVGGDDLLRVSTATGVVERVPGFTHGPSKAVAFDVDGTGSKAFFLGENFLGKSPSGTSLFLADQLAKPMFTIGKDAPTLLSWDPDPESTRYDVVRGDVASLAIVGSTVDLGPVTCVEDDSPDNATAGNEDTIQPPPGQTFFYLYRGTKGSPPVTASWGQGTGARERIAAACNP